MRFVLVNVVLFAVIATVLLAMPASSSSSSSPSAIVLRVRLPDGSMERLALPASIGENEVDVDLTLRQVLSGILANLKDEDNGEDDTMKVLLGPAREVLDLSRPVSSLRLSNGALLTLVSSSKSGRASTTPARNQPLALSTVASSSASGGFDPFPDLAKNREFAVQQTKKRRRMGTSRASFSQLQDWQSALHLVEPQPEGALKRVYMCHVSASRFQANCVELQRKWAAAASTGNGATSKKKGKATKSKKNESQKQSQQQQHAALLLGTISRERVNSERKPRTSLSSTTEQEEYCHVAKVQCLWEPPTRQLSTKLGKSEHLALIDNLKSSSRVVRVAGWLGLRPVGWIFGYGNDGDNEKTKKSGTASRRKSSKSENNDGDGDDSLPVKGRNVVTGARLQIENMKRLQKGNTASGSTATNGEDDVPHGFVTLAMESHTGATEAFQLSDVSVQMVAEGLFLLEGDVDDRYVKTSHPVLVDNQETQLVDSVLCLVNTALLSNEGLFAGKTQNSIKATNGSLTTKTRKALLKASRNSDNDASLLALLCDFNVLLALDELLAANPDDTQQLCAAVKKFARGQKRGTSIDGSLKQRLVQVLEL